MTEIQQRILDRLARLRPGTTMCPGRLARDCQSNLRSLRPDLLALAASGKIVLLQGGHIVAAAA